MEINYKFTLYPGFEYNIFPQTDDDIQYWKEMSQEMDINLNEQWGTIKIW